MAEVRGTDRGAELAYSSTGITGAGITVLSSRWLWHRGTARVCGAGINSANHAADALFEVFVDETVLPYPLPVLP
eukprot:2592517-Rhodomonas_salina.1